MQLITTKYTFALCKLLKHSRPGYVYRPVTYKNYPQNIKLCPIRLITEYIKKRSNLLQSNTSMKSYFMTYRKPIRAAHRETVTRWTKNIMHESGYVMLCILYLKSTHKNSSQKNNKYRLIDATLTPGDQVWSLAVVTTAAATTYSDEV